MAKQITEFSKKLVELRKAANLSQDELSEKIFLSRQSISKWENGESVPDMNNLVQLAKVLEVSLDELVLGFEPVNSQSRLMKEFLDADKSDNQQPINNGWEWLARFWWVIVGIIWMLLIFL